MRPKFHVKELRQPRELNTFGGDALEHVDCAIYNLLKQSVDNVVYVVVVDDDHDEGNDDVVNAAYDDDDDDDDGKNEEVTKRFGDNDEV